MLLTERIFEFVIAVKSREEVGTNNSHFLFVCFLFIFPSILQLMAPEPHLQAVPLPSSMGTFEVIGSFTRPPLSLVK